MLHSRATALNHNSLNLRLAKRILLKLNQTKLRSLSRSKKRNAGVLNLNYKIKRRKKLIAH
jgi:hypothetical protein